MTAPDNLSSQSSTRRAELLIVGGTVTTASGAERIDVAYTQGRIVALGDLNCAWSAETTLDATGFHVLPGVIDSQVHFREPGLVHKENIEAGTRGAVLGGVTAVFEMPNTQPLTLSASRPSSMRRVNELGAITRFIWAACSSTPKSSLYSRICPGVPA